MKPDMSDLYVTWDDYNRLIERLAVIVHDSGWQFDSIICLARGGLRVGDALSRIFDKPLGVMTTSSYRASGGTVQGNLKIGSQISAAEEVTRGRVLLADDLVDSGDTLQAVLPELRRRYPAMGEIRTAVLWYKSVSVCRPDYYAQFLETSPWIHQPFEAYEGCDIETLRQPR
ncbi:MAG: phosphoribosyltransferase [Lautropia sp.]|nr:phosphoribosyltransferase [Lautropia sp.]